MAANLRTFKVVDGADRSYRAHNDLGNSLRLVERYSHKLRYAPGIGRLHWDGVRWRHDDDGTWMRHAKHVVRQMFDEAATITDNDRRKEAAKHAARSGSEPRLRAMLTLAETEPGIIVGADDLDADPFLLNVANGILHLRDNSLRPHDPRLLQTKLAPVRYDPNATHTIVDKVLHDATGGDRQLLEFLQRAIGYSLTGDTS